MPSGDDKQDLDLGVPMRTAAKEQKLFGRYTLKRVLGRGGMGIVWLAHDDELIRYVAMKFLPDMLVRDREAVEDLKRETRRSLDLTHHHIVRIYDFTQDEMCAAIIMEFVDGETLSAMKSQQPGGCFGVSVAAPWVAHFASALDYAHRQARVIHRDLKPANLMINSRGELKITDFGISRSMSDSMTRVSVSNTAGTLAYMSPEQALGAPPMPGDDIYAFGATVYDLLTGRPPFFRGNLQVQLETVIPPRMEDRRAELGNSAEPIPELWQEVIAACLAKRPQDRPQSIAEVASMLGLSGAAANLRPGTSAGGITGGTSATTRTRTDATEEAITDQQAGEPAASAARPATSRPSNVPRPTGLDDIFGVPSVRDEFPIVPDQARVTAKPTQGTGIARTVPPEDLTISGQKASEFTDAPLLTPMDTGGAEVASSPASAPSESTSTPERRSSRGLAVAASVSLVLVAGGLAWMFLKPGSASREQPVTSAPTAAVFPPGRALEPALSPVPPPAPPRTYDTEVQQIRNLIGEDKVSEAALAIATLPQDLPVVAELRASLGQKEAALKALMEQQASAMKAASEKAANDAKMAKQQQEISSLIAEAKALAGKEDYAAARIPLQRILTEYDEGNEAANAQMAEINAAEIRMFKKREDELLKTIVDSAEQALKDGDFTNAEKMLETAPPSRMDDPAVEELTQRIGAARRDAMNRPRTVPKSTASTSKPKSSGSSSSKTAARRSDPPPVSRAPVQVSRPVVSQPKPVISRSSQQPPAPRKQTPFRGGAPGG